VVEEENKRVGLIHSLGGDNLKMILLFIIFSMISISLVSAVSICNPNLPNGCPKENKVTISPSINYTSTLNGSYVPYSGATENVDLNPFSLYINTLYSNNWSNSINTEKISWNPLLNRWDSTASFWFGNNIFAPNICYSNGTNCVAPPSFDKTNIAYTNITNVFNESQYVAEGMKIGFRGNALLPENESYFFYNVSNKTLQLYVNGKIQQEWGASTRVFGVATFDEGIQGGQTNETGTVYNVSAGNFIGYLDWKYLLNVPKALNITAGESLKLVDSDGNTTVEVERTPKDKKIIFTSNGTDMMTIYPSGIVDVVYNLSAQNVIAGNICYSDGTNCTTQNTTQTNYTISAFNHTATLTTSSGSGSISTPNLNGFLITKLTVIPNTNTSSYNFYANLTNLGDVVDQNRKSHIGTWAIRKNQAYSDTLTYTITNSTPAVETYTIKMDYINNIYP
jgi:hypothetical protein